MRSNVDLELPEDLIVEIFSRVPATSLVRFRSISKRWNALIKNERFTKKYLAIAPRPSLVIMLNKYRVSLVRVVHRYNVALSVNITNQFSLKDPLSNSSKEVDIRQVFHCDGLLLCVTKDNRLVVWNPCSGETRWIRPSNSYTEYDQYVIGKSSCNKYKILRMNQSYVSVWETKCDVYDFSSDSWRIVGKIRDWFIDVMYGVFIKGYSYWLAVNHQQQQQGYMLLSFDFSKESFQSQIIPHSALLYPVTALSVFREEHLCLLTRHGDDTIDVWMGSKIDESRGVMSWSKFLTVKTICYMFSHGMNFFANKENNVLHIVGEDGHMTVDHGAKSSYSILLSYVPTLVQIPQVI